MTLPRGILPAELTGGKGPLFKGGDPYSPFERAPQLGPLSYFMRCTWAAFALNAFDQQKGALRKAYVHWAEDG
jgi:hypothetical protein